MCKKRAISPEKSVVTYKTMLEKLHFLSIFLYFNFYVSTLLFETESHHIVSKPQGYITCLFRLPSARILNMHQYALLFFLMWILGIKLKSLFLQDKHFTDWALTPALISLISLKRAL